ncbi:MAG: hypothetical protein QY326_02070 [Bdellovibrionota bacterium]|nr:MAG: hypothetical protein QY326_02070 [Bdellovibrionota bacterium]
MPSTQQGHHVDPCERRIVTPAEQQEIFWKFNHSAFRVETLDTYAVVDDDRVLREYVNGGINPPFTDSGWTAWYDRVKAAVSAGKEMVRVHLIPEVLTPYLRYEIEWAYTLFNAPAGEKVYLVNIDRHPRFVELRGRDFYLFDASSVLEINFDGSQLKNMEFDNTPGTVSKFTGLRDELMKVAVPLSDYLKMMREAPLRVSF